jgi:hypothetical protein
VSQAVALTAPCIPGLSTGGGVPGNVAGGDDKPPSGDDKPPKGWREGCCEGCCKPAMHGGTLS